MKYLAGLLAKVSGEGCTGKRFLLHFLASVIDPDLALALVPEHATESIEGLTPSVQGLDSVPSSR
jgi:hypothetical protein